MRKLMALAVSIALLHIGHVLAQSTRTVTGTVTDEKGNTLSNVTISVLGPEKRVIKSALTDQGGNFSIQITERARGLQFSFVGYEEQFIPIAGKTDVQVKLVSNASNLAEIVVVGYGVQKRKDVIGNIATVSGSAVADKPVQSFEQALGGRAAGVQITVPNGVVNNPPVFRIRGTNSISLSSYPLIVIDGVATFTGDIGSTNAAANPLASINPSDIESIDILKDAAAAAIYGSRAANGVVIITTKKGKQGKAKVSYDGWVSWTKAQRLPKLLNAQQYTDIKNEGLKNAGTFDNTNADSTKWNYFALTPGPDGRPIDTKWYDYIYRTGISHNHAVSVAGGSEATSYYFSAGYTHQEGIIRKNDFIRKNVLFNVDHKANKVISLGAKISYSNEQNLAATSSGSLAGEAFSTAGLGRTALVNAPNVSPYNSDGSYNIGTTFIGVMRNKVPQVGFYNPVVLLDLNRSNNEIDHIQSNGYIQIKPFSWVSLRSVYGIDYLNVDNDLYWNPKHGDGQSYGGYALDNFLKNKRWTWTNTAQFDYVFAEKHSLGLLIGNEQQRTTQSGYGINRQTLSDPAFDVIQAGFQTNNSANMTLTENYLLSSFARLTYDFGKKYYINGNIRQDEYSAFGSGKKKGVFWGVGAGWEVAKEDFWSKARLDKIFSGFKLRGSYGKVGNFNGLGNFASYSFYNSGLYGGDATLVFNQTGNDLLGWETSKKLDVGVNLGLFQNKVTIDAAYYYNNLDGLIYAVPQAPSAGLPSSPQLNIASMYNRGFELTINATPVSTKDFSWTTSFNISFNKNKVTSLAEGIDQFITTSPAGSTTSESVSLTKVGNPLGMLYVVRTAGVDAQTGRRIFINSSGKKVYFQLVPPTGQFQYSYEDGSRAPSISIADAQIYRNSMPRQLGGFDNTFRFKNFDLNLLFTYQLGFYIYYGSNAGLRDQRYWNNSTDMLRRWQNKGDNTDIPKVVNGDNVSNGSSFPIDVNVFKGDFLKLRNLSLGYSLPRTMLEKIKLSNLRLYVSAQNLWIITKYPGPDPENSSNGNNATNQGIDRNQVANGRTITVGLNVNF